MVDVVYTCVVKIKGTVLRGICKYMHNAEVFQIAEWLSRVQLRYRAFLENCT